MTIREHLQKAHSFMAEHHREMSKCHSAAMGKADGMGEFHKSAMAAHEAAADQHDEMASECEKATSAELAKMIPTRVSAVTPTAPVRAVPRHGQRDLATLAADIDPMFKALVTVDENEENER